MNLQRAAWGMTLCATCFASPELKGAEIKSSPPPYKQLSYDENYSYLRTARGNDLFDPIKYIPLNQSGDFYLSFGGEARVRYEYFHNPQWGLAPQDNNGY